MSTLTNSIESVVGAGDNLLVTDTTDWTQTSAGLRSEYGVYIQADYRLGSDPESIYMANASPLTAEDWIVPSLTDGRYSIKTFAFKIYDEAESPVEGMARVSAEGVLIKYLDAEWVDAILADEIAAVSYAYTSNTSEVPLLSHAYAYRNKLNLEYISTVKNDIVHGEHQNEMYYKRTTLDYFYGLILAAEYNWYQALYQNFYDITNNLNNILNTGKLS